MTKSVRLTPEEQLVLGKMDVKQLAFFSKLSDQAEFNYFVQLVNKMIDEEKNRFFREKEYQPQVLAIEHSYSRGTVGGMTKLLRIIASSSHELAKREEGVEKKKGFNKKT